MPESSTQAVVQQIAIKVNGNNLAATVLEKLEYVYIESSLALPSMFVLRFHDDDVSLIDGTIFALGAAVVISLPSGQSMAEVINAEITAIEPDFDTHTASLTVRGYDKRHRLTYGTFTRTFVNVTDSDIISTIAGEVGLQVRTGATSNVHEHVFQDNQTDLHFIQDRAIRNGFGLYMDGTTLVFDKFTQGGTVTLNWGETLTSFSPRLSLVGQLNKVAVRGWDIKQKTAIVAEKTTSTTHPSIGVGKSGGQAVNTAISKQPTLTELRRSVTTQAEAETIAQGLLDKVNAGFIEADGVALGTAALIAGAKVQLGKLSTKFNGTYVVSMARHIYEEGTYMTEFRVEGYQPKMLGDLLQSSSSAAQIWNGVVVAIVTNNNDSEGKMARVKVKYPWLADDKESGWARVATMGAGNERGFLWIPEVNDEVLVAFENGDFNRPFVIGSLYNGRDKPHEATFVEGGKIELRTIKTRAGHVIRLNDKSGEEKIEIIDAKNKTSIVMDTANEKVTIMAGKDIHIEGTATSMMLKSKDITLDATNKVTIKAAAGIDITSNSTLNMKSSGAMSIESTAAMTVKGTASLSLQSSGTAELKANGPLSLSSTAITEVKGSMVKIN